MNWHKDFLYRDGILYWNRNLVFVKKGDIAGKLEHYGYWIVTIGGPRKRRSRIVWEMHNGLIPDGLEIDHINRDRQDDRIENLRAVTRSINQHNIGVMSNNKLGVRGVNKDGKGFRAYIHINGKTKNLGKYTTIEEASRVYEAAKMEFA